MENETNTPLGLEDFQQISEEVQSQLAPSTLDNVETEEPVANEGSNTPKTKEEKTGLELVASEAGAALVGGAADAIESVGGFAELTGDTFKTGFNKLFGRPVDDTQNPFSDQYLSNDAGFLDIPDSYVPENQTGLGKLVRGLTEFGFLTVATGGIGSYTVGAARLGARGAVMAGKMAGGGAKGLRTIQFVKKGTKLGSIATEGAIADLVSSSSESENLANLVNEHTPWMSSWVTEALAHDPEDNPWLSRIKTVTTGAGVNVLGHFLIEFAQSSWRAHRRVKAGEDPTIVNETENATMAKNMEKRVEADQKDFDTKVEDNKAQGKGKLGKEGDELRASDNFVNANNYDNVEKAGPAGLEPDNFRKNIKESIDADDNASWTDVFTESSLAKIARGDAKVKEHVIKFAKTIVQEAFQSVDNTMDYKAVQKLILRQTAELTSMIDDGGDIAKSFQEFFLKNDKNARVYLDDGETIVTATPAQKAALQMTIHTLSKRAQAIANGTLFLADDLPMERQFEMTMDAMKVALIEHKKMGYMWGLDGRYQQTGALPSIVKKKTREGIAELQKDVDEHIEAIKKLGKEGRYDEIADLQELMALTGGKVRTMEHMYEFLKKRIFGGRLDGVQIKGRFRQELQGMFYNSILSAPKTATKAIFGTNMIALLRPFQQYIGAAIKLDKKEMAIAASQIDAIGQAWAEGIQMFKYNWDLGVHNKTMSYEGKFDLENDLAEWQSLRTYYEKYGSDSDRRAYAAMDRVVNLNVNPWMKYSQNAMGAGDALARTIIGRMALRQRATRAALEKGIDPADMKKFIQAKEDEFRNQIFKKDGNDRWVVSDKGARMAGDEAAMTKALEENFKGFELISNIPLMKAFFPFVRTGFNSLELTFKHTPLVRFREEYKDIMTGKNLEKYGIKPEDLASAQAIMRGREAMGTAIMGMAGIAALSGKLTGDYPYKQEDRDAWQAAGVQPYSYVANVGGKDFYISYANLEPFNTLFSTMANVVTNADLLGEDAVDNWVQKLSFMTTAVLVDKSMLSGVEDLASLMNSGTTEDMLLKTGARYARSHLPYQGLLGQLGDIMDANRKETDTFLETFAQRDAFMKSALSPKYDILAKDRKGEKLAYGPSNVLGRIFNAFSPIPITDTEPDPLRQTLVDMRFNMPEVMSEYKGEPLSAFERSELQRFMAQGDLRRRLKKVMDSKSFKREFQAYKDSGLTDAGGDKLYKQGFYIMVREEFERAKKIAMSQALKANPDLRERAKIRQGQATLGKAGAYEKLQEWKNRTGI